MGFKIKKPKSNLEDPANAIGQLPPGSCLWAREQIDCGATEIAWMVREETETIQLLGKTVDIEFRASVIERDGVMLIPVLVRVGQENPESVYESWINIHAHGLANPLPELAMQPRLIVHLYGDSRKLERSLAISNHLMEFSREAIRQTSESRPWSMASYDAARDKIYQQHATVWELWEGLCHG